LKRGDKVIVGQRSRPNDLLPNAEYVDILNKETLNTLGKGKLELTEIVVSLGFKYDKRVWTEVWPIAMRNLISLGEESGARMIFVDNLYMYGPQSTVITEDMPLYNGKNLQKPQVRADITRMWMKACEEHRLLPYELQISTDQIVCSHTLESLCFLS